MAVGWAECNEAQQSLRECYVGLRKLSTNLLAVFNPVYCRQKLALFYGLSGRVFERSEFSATP
ncbi:MULTISPECIES: hypothetical protein [unclassified Methylophaga]|uniref:hypothetical protein n=1 Tax=unclassified Methylophaga TaxID=2629249 RepID=UPI000C10F9C2|nr:MULTISPECIES: hypothetical protein [unclassified Methylophaga]MBL1458732.1 hypothetical protein [Methylophaga sp.]